MHHPFALFHPGAAFHHLTQNDGMHHPFCFHSLQWSNPQHYTSQIKLVDFVLKKVFRFLFLDLCRDAVNKIESLLQSHLEQPNKWVKPSKKAPMMPDKRVKPDKKAPTMPDKRVKPDKKAPMMPDKRANKALRKDAEKGAKKDFIDLSSFNLSSMKQYIKFLRRQMSVISRRRYYSDFDERCYNALQMQVEFHLEEIAKWQKAQKRLAHPRLAEDCLKKSQKTSIGKAVAPMKLVADAPKKSVAVASKKFVAAAQKKPVSANQRQTSRYLKGGQKKTPVKAVPQVQTAAQAQPHVFY
ncbi:hypothetical protein L596_021241 [Steinernema carpocapsae]|uniref:Uncharacterized protein n=1 Tax=Steinernema carpocapsae TaxID=34508 RepID=A0A4U5MW88_STECR|nr:hypothetical protein L596_021241 [Steinernema carpocapsae]